VGGAECVFFFPFLLFALPAVFVPRPSGLGLPNRRKTPSRMLQKHALKQITL